MISLVHLSESSYIVIINSATFIWLGFKLLLKKVFLDLTAWISLLVTFLYVKLVFTEKQHRRSVSSATTGLLDASHLQPWDCISCDQSDSTSPGLIPTFKGTPSTSSYHAGTLFVEHARRYLFFTPHLSTDAVGAVQAKQSFEFHASSVHHIINKYHSDSCIFSSKLFHDTCLSHRQHIEYCGIDAHHQNGIAKRYI
jgi:hypothetical protein